MLLQSLIWGLMPERFLIIYTLWAPPFHESYFILWNSQEGETRSSMTPVLISITLSAEPNKLASSLSHDISSEMWRSTILSGYSTVNRTSFSCSVTWSHLRSPIPLSTFPFYLFLATPSSLFGCLVCLSSAPSFYSVGWGDWTHVTRLGGNNGKTAFPCWALLPTLYAHSLEHFLFPVLVLCSFNNDTNKQRKTVIHFPRSACNLPSFCLPKQPHVYFTLKNIFVVWKATMH